MLKRFIKNAVFFIILILLTFFFLVRGQNFENIVSVVSKVNIWYIVIGILVMSFYLLGDALNCKMLLAKFGYKKSFLTTLKYAFIGFFYSAITPSSSGGQPMQLYHMSKENIDISHGTVVLLLQACSYHIIALLYMVIGTLYNGAYLLENLHYFLILFVLGITGTACILTILLGFLFSKKATNFFTNIALKVIKKLKLKKEDEITEKLMEEVSKFRESSAYLKENKTMLIKMLLITFVQMTAFHSVTYVTLNALGLNAPYFKVLTLQAVLFSSVTSIPLPGSIGVSELGFGVVFLPIFGEKLITSATVLNRFMNFYFYVFVSLIVSVISYLKINKSNRE